MKNTFLFVIDSHNTSATTATRGDIASNYLTMCPNATGVGDQRGSDGGQ
jgi:hypothetical protein